MQLNEFSSSVLYPLNELIHSNWPQFGSSSACPPWSRWTQTYWSWRWSGPIGRRHSEQSGLGHFRDWNIWKTPINNSCPVSLVVRVTSFCTNSTRFSLFHLIVITGFCTGPSVVVVVVSPSSSSRFSSMWPDFIQILLDLALFSSRICEKICSNLGPSHRLRESHPGIGFPVDSQLTRLIRSAEDWLRIGTKLSENVFWLKHWRST